MAPFRPTNLNKKAYPGNANVIGPTVTASVGYTTTTCCSTVNVCTACVCLGTDICLGCRYFGGCACPCCDACCSCPCTVCTRTIPSGMWSTSEQLEAAQRDAWGSSTCSAGSATCLSSTNKGITCCSGVITDCKGYYVCLSGATKWFVSPVCTEVTRAWASRNDAVTVSNSCMGSLGWFVPDCAQLKSVFLCKTYYDCLAGTFWSNSEWNANAAPHINDGGGGWVNSHNKGGGYKVRAFRTV